MTPVAETLDLSTVELTDSSVRKLCDCIKRWASMIASTAPEASRISIRLTVDEFVKNALHGDCAVVSIIPLSDGSFLLTTDDEVGTDHIPAGLDGHCGTIIINTLVGEENYRLYLDRNHYRGFLRIDPHHIKTAI